MGLEKGHSYSVRFHTAVLQVEIYTIRACVMENVEKGYTGRNICILCDRQTESSGPSQLPDKLQISPELPSIPGETGRI
jgi:hypothetical protein